MQTNRITENEELLDSINTTIVNTNKALEEFKTLKEKSALLNKYYGSKEWFKDKEDLESGKISNTKAGVLSEDAVWNMNEDLSDTIKEMKEIIQYFSK